MYFDWHTLLGAGGSILLLALTIPYIKSVVNGPTRPSATSWLGWAFIDTIATVAQASKGISWSLAVPFIGALVTAIIAVVSLCTGRAVWTRIDKYAIVLSVVVITLWAITQEPLTAIILSILADTAVTIPTIFKTYRQPKSEPAVLWALYAVGASMEIIATQHFTVYNLLYPLYVVINSSVIATLAFRTYISNGSKRPFTIMGAADDNG